VAVGQQADDVVEAPIADPVVGIGRDVGGALVVGASRRAGQKAARIGRAGERARRVAVAAASDCRNQIGTAVPYRVAPRVGAPWPGQRRRGDRNRGAGARPGGERVGAGIIGMWKAFADVGRAIHPSYVEGQIQGGVTQGIGWALNEEYIYDKDGRLENPGYLDYRMPVASDLPMIDAVMIEIPNPRHPFGAKGVGEVPIVPPMAAVANAIADATGIRMRDLPMSPPKLRAALDEAPPPRMAAE
jgi:hypothetical protein